MLGPLPPRFSGWRWPAQTAFSRFRRNRDGATAIEFSFVALPFLALLFAIIETALVFFAGQALETGVADASRLIMTGQAQQSDWGSGTAGTSATLDQKMKQFRCQICERAGALIDCNEIKFDVREAASFGGADAWVSPEDASVDTSGFGFDAGEAGSIMVVRAIYEYPVYVGLMNQSLSNVGGNKRLLVGTATFRNEPFPAPTAGTPPAQAPVVTPDCP